MRRSPSVAASALGLLLAACGGGGAPSAPASPGVSIVLSPRAAAVTSGQQQSFTATVSAQGGATSGISWSVDGVDGGNAAAGTVSAAGLYIPGTAVGVHTVTATSQWNGSYKTSATVAVTDLAGVYTYHNDVARTGQNRQEYALTSMTVAGTSFGKRFACAVDGQLYAQPLYVANLSIGGGMHNVVFAATQHDSVYAFDADDIACRTLWKTSLLGAGATTIPAGDTGITGDLSPEFGITSTPVIDPASGTMYVLASTKEAGQFVQRLHVLDIATGLERAAGPVTIQAAVPGVGTGSDGVRITFDTRIHNQRAALLLLNGIVYVAWAAHGDLGNYHGWVMGYDAATLAQVSTFNATPNADEGGIWMSGGGPAADVGGSVYLITGNGGFDAGNTLPLQAPFDDLGDSVVRLSPASGLAVADYFTPGNQLALAQGDVDLGSSAAMVLPDGIGPAAQPNLVVGGGKEGRLYVMDRQDMGRYHSGGPDAVLQSLLVPGGCGTCGLYASPVFWQTGAGGGTLFVGAVNDSVRAFPLSAGRFAASASAATSELYGFPGASLAVSSSGATNGIVWALDTSHNGTANPGLALAPAILRAYDAGSLRALYSSDAKTADAAGNAAKFAVPLVANGRVYVAGDHQLTVYGLLP
jgi:hypothetical protein